MLFFENAFNPENRLRYSPDSDVFAGLSKPVSPQRMNYGLSKKIRAEIFERVENEPLNPEQRKAVDHVEGPLLVLAGAGTGKTRVVTSRIARLVSLGVRPRRILAVTFTNKAANEMRDRCKTILGPYCKGKPTVKTLHSLCSNILKIHAHELGYSRNVEIVSDIYQERFLHLALRKLPWHVLQKMGKNPEEELASKISLWKNNLLGPKYVLEQYNKQEKEIAKKVLSDYHPGENEFEFAEGYVEYQRWLKRGEMIDCDDLLRLAVGVLTASENSENILRKWQNRYDYILVDEYQDTNTAQFELLKAVAGIHKNICVVGDDDQSIYGWRAANVELIRKFPVHFSDEDKHAEIIKLETNYRCTQPILDLGNNLMEHEKDRHQKNLRAHKKGGVSPVMIVHKDEHEEAKWLADTVLERTAGGNKYNTNAILVRDQYRMQPILSAFQHAKIPYEVWSSDDTQMGEIKRNVYALLAVIHDPKLKDYAFMPLLESSPVSLPNSDYQLLLQAIDNNQKDSFWEAINSSEIIRQFTDSGRDNVFRLVDLVQNLHEKASSKNRKESLSKITAEAIDGLYSHLTSDKGWQSNKKPSKHLKMLQDIHGYVVSWEKTAKTLTLNSFLGWNNRIRLRAKEPRRGEEDAVIVSTYHAAKGLEFDCVFMPVMVEGVLPTKRSIEAEEKREYLMINEERRLAYVGITRAKDELYISWPRHRKVGRKKDVVQVPSRFLHESGASALYDPENLRSVVRPNQKELF